MQNPPHRPGFILPGMSGSCHFGTQSEVVGEERQARRPTAEEEAMNRYWISWYQPTEDFRPLTDPPNPSVLAWWCSGQRMDGQATLVALVTAATESEAQAVILKDWPEVTEWRFNEYCEKDWLPGDRFPITKGWQRERLGLS